jgi:hypothetical protein
MRLSPLGTNTLQLGIDAYTILSTVQGDRMNLLSLRSFAIALLALTVAGAALAQTGVTTTEVSAIYFDQAPFVPADNVGETVPGSWASLGRTDSGVTLNIRTTDLTPGAYTIWWIVFNNPELCTDGACGEDDIFAAPFQPIDNGDGTFGTPGVMVQIMYAGGNVVGENGMGHFGSGLSEGDNSGGILPGPGLVDTSKAEIHNIIRYHGPVVAEYMPAMIHSLDGGCDASSNGPLEDGVGFTCNDAQAVVHPLP